MWKYPQGFHRERRLKYPHRKFSFMSPEFPQGNYVEISAGMLPWNSPINLRGNLGHMDGSPAGQCHVIWTMGRYLGAHNWCHGVVSNGLNVIICVLFYYRFELSVIVCLWFQTILPPFFVRAHTFSQSNTKTVMKFYPNTHAAKPCTNTSFINGIEILYQTAPDCGNLSKRSWHHLFETMLVSLCTKIDWHHFFFAIIKQ